MYCSYCILGASPRQNQCTCLCHWRINILVPSYDLISFSSIDGKCSLAFYRSFMHQRPSCWNRCSARRHGWTHPAVSLTNVHASPAESEAHQWLTRETTRRRKMKTDSRKNHRSNLSAREGLSLPAKLLYFGLFLSFSSFFSHFLVFRFYIVLSLCARNFKSERYGIFFFYIYILL